MRQFKIGTRVITDESVPYIVAELGSNHMGDFQLCRQMVDSAIQAGVDAVKLQKRDNRYLFTKAFYDAPYNSEHAFAPTYGEHRDKLEFGEYEFKAVRQMCDRAGIHFIATPFEERSAEFLHNIGVDAFKIASSQLKDIPLMLRMSKYKRPIILSTGGGKDKDIVRAWDVLSDAGVEFAILHCTSLYPTRDEDLHLDFIQTLRTSFQDTVIGFSSHHPGLEPNIIAVILGARILEVHFTMNRGFPGTDHGFSFEPGGLRRLVEDAKRIPVMRGCSHKVTSSKERSGFVFKQGRAVHVTRPIAAGEKLGFDNIGLKAPADGPPPYELGRYVGKIAVCDLSTSDVLSPEVVQDGPAMGDL